VILGNRREELRDAKVISIVPVIAAEVLSPSETPRMIQRKMKQYFEAGVKEVWIIHPKSLRVEIWTGLDRMAHELSGSDSVTSPLLPGFALSLDALFEEQP
jgi:Uma2 family endonuclease